MGIVAQGGTARLDGFLQYVRISAVSRSSRAVGSPAFVTSVPASRRGERPLRLSASQT